MGDGARRSGERKRGHDSGPETMEDVSGVRKAASVGRMDSVELVDRAISGVGELEWTAAEHHENPQSWNDKVAPRISKGGSCDEECKRSSECCTVAGMVGGAGTIRSDVK